MGLFVIYGFDTASTLAEETNDPRRVAPRAVLGSVAAAFIVGFIFLWAMLMAVPGEPRRGRRRRRHLAAGDHPGQPLQRARHRLPARRLVRDLRLLPGDPGLDDPARLLDGARPPAAGLGPLSTVHPRTGTPVGACLARRGDGRDLLPQVRRRGVHRDRGERDDLPLLHPRQPGDPAGAAARLLRAARRAVLARPLGDAREHPGARVGRLDARQLHVAPGRDQPEAGGDRRAARLRRRVPQQDPDPVVGARRGPAPRRHLLRRARSSHIPSPVGARSRRGRRAGRVRPYDRSAAPAAAARRGRWPSAARAVVRMRT